MEEMKSYDSVENGVILYEKSNAKSALDAPTGKVGAKGWAQRIYMVILGAVLVGWCLYSIINMANQPEMTFAKAIVAHIASFFVLLVAEFILMLTAFGKWGKFARTVLRNKALTRQRGMEGVRTRQLAEELNEADRNKAKENAVRVYKDFVVVVNDGEATTIERSQLQRVTCEPRQGGYQLTFYLYDDTQIVANQLLPFVDLPLVKKQFDSFEYTPAPRGKGYIKKKFPMLAFAFIPLIIGVALTVVHCLVLPEMPIVFGILFMAFGVMFITAQFNDVAVIRNGVMTIMGGLLLTGMPLGIAFTLADLVESITVASILSTFTPIHAVLSLFWGLGPMLIIVGIGGVFDSIKL